MNEHCLTPFSKHLIASSSIIKYSLSLLQNLDESLSEGQTIKLLVTKVDRNKSKQIETNRNKSKQTEIWMKA